MYYKVIYSGALSGQAVLQDTSADKVERFLVHDLMTRLSDRPDRSVVYYVILKTSCDNKVVSMKSGDKDVSPRIMKSGEVRWFKEQGAWCMDAVPSAMAQLLIQKAGQKAGAA
jgi:hypothetical protein